MNKFYLTTPIYYPNARPHVGSAYTTIVCDAIARYKRLCGYDVAFLTGTDEHGEKLQRAADAAGIPVERFVAEKRELFKELWRTLGIPQYGPEHPAGYRFVHTSQNPAHVKSVQWMIRQADKAECIEKRRYEGRYCVFDERYVSDSPEPVNCDICGRPAELISEENYFFKLSAFGPSKPGLEDGPLMELYKRHEKDPAFAPFVQPDFRMNEVKSFVKSGLRDISISRRRLKWGIPWPDDAEQVVYVWYDALTSYLTGIGFEGDKRSKDFEKYWMGADGEAEVVHMIGKDILRFHAVYWPAFLMAANLPLPKTIFAHGWIYYEQDKMSKSKGNVVYPEPIVEGNGLVPERPRKASDEEFEMLVDATKLVGNDALRYYLLRDTPFGLDGSFDYEALIDRYNFDLANDLGNLANRTLTMLNRYLGGIVPRAPEQTQNLNQLRFIKRRAYDANARFERLDFSRGLEAVWAAVGTVNQWLTESQPWKLAEDPRHQDQLEIILYTAADFLRLVGVLIYPVLPEGSRKLWAQLADADRIEDQKVHDVERDQLKPGTRVGKPEPIFPRLDKAATLAKLHELAEQDRERDQPKETILMSSEELPAVSNQPSATPSLGAQASPATPTDQKISIDDFVRVEMRAGQVLAAEPIPGATKLLKLQVDIGSEVRQVCAGIAEYYKPDELIGMKVVIVANLEPRKLRGVESNGMIVAASVGPDGKPVLATFKEDVPNGARLK